MKFLFVSVVLLTVTNCSATPQPLFPTGDMFDMTINVPSGNSYKQQYLFFGDYNFYGVELDRKLHVYRNGSVSFGGEIDSGAPYIKGFSAENSTSTDFNVEFFMDNGHDNCKTDMFQARKEHAEHLLRHFAAEFEANYTYMFALTWNNMTYCKDENGIQNATFQIALVSYEMKTTYVFLLYNHTGNNTCENHVIVEISNGNPCQTFTHSSNSGVQQLVSSNRRTGVDGAYVYRVDRPDNENELNFLLYGEGIGDQCLDGDSDPRNRQSASSSVVEHLPLNGKYTFYGQQYSDVAVCGNGVIRFGDDTTSCNSNLTTSTTPIVVGFGQSITFDESVANYRERYLYTNADMYERDYFMTNKYRVMNLLECGFKSLHGFNATHILHAAYPANDATIQIVIATEECKQDTYALLIYNSTVESNDEVHIGFSSGSGRNYAIPHTKHLAENSNIGVPGVYAYRIDEEKIIDHNSDCGNLTNPTNGIVNYTSTTLRSQANYTCNAYCPPKPIHTRVCMKTGHSATWSAEEPSCPDICCGSLCNPKNGWVNISVSSGPKLMANYTCEAGYKPIGDSERVCECIGRWSGDEPHCEAI